MKAWAGTKAGPRLLSLGKPILLRFICSQLGKFQLENRQTEERGQVPSKQVGEGTLLEGKVKTQLHVHACIHTWQSVHTEGNTGVGFTQGQVEGS